MHDVSLGVPPVALVRCAVAAVWLYEGLWCKLLGRERNQLTVVQQVPLVGSFGAERLLVGVGLVETALAIWVMSGELPGICLIVQVGLLVTLNANGLLWARHVIHDPWGMVVKNISFLLLAWTGAAMSGATS